MKKKRRHDEWMELEREKLKIDKEKLKLLKQYLSTRTDLG